MAKELLENIRVISMGSAWAGPYVGRVLAELGAEVFRIELHGGTRYGRGAPEAEEAWKKKLLTLKRISLQNVVQSGLLLCHRLRGKQAEKH